MACLDWRINLTIDRVSINWGTASDQIAQGITVIKIVCGLGNPGPQYRSTRHNLGFEIIDCLAGRLKTASTESAPLFESRKAALDRGDVYLVKPDVYVNLSGLAAREAMRDFEAGPDEFFVISDDFNLPLGALRIRKWGSAGGHKGLISIIDEIGSDRFPRMRVGTGPLPEEVLADRESVSDFVLSRFLPEEEEIVKDIVSRSVEAIRLALDHGLDLAISKYNSAGPTPEN